MEPPEESGGPAAIGTLSQPARTVVALALAAAAVGVAVHLLMVFLHVAPSNTATKKHGELVGSYIYPEFEQNWKLFAPNPLQQNIHVWARAEVRKDEGGSEVTGWVDLTAMDIAAIRHNVAPSHTEQNQLRRAWSFYAASHGEKDKPIGVRGELSRQYLQRIVEDRFGPRLNGGDVVRLQVRSGTTPVAAPAWSPEKTDTRTTFQVLPWWSSDVADQVDEDEGGEDAS
ncbi:DUF5819 family protein [Actinacidiphila glaucinigra]|uniref:Uncharacterized protein n=1 Tax=Actinacidiphila glaucinigra TaxID=235986 RepID=A0A239ME63_9ACTN|nr:DUF5819 family protein [Actinacidiphila glaucinigra]SNT40258.1 hypothetical protein SAMN05216252_123139 [Actinacidiphila glaucinigra]